MFTCICNCIYMLHNIFITLLNSNPNFLYMTNIIIKMTLVSAPDLSVLKSGADH